MAPPVEVTKLTINHTSTALLGNNGLPLATCADSAAIIVYRKKYRKLRFKFHQSMKRSDELFKQEQTAKAAVRRILEENTFASQFYPLCPPSYGVVPY